MSSLSNNYGKKHLYKQLNSLNAKDLKKYKNIVLIVIDGLGYNYLKKQKDSFLNKHLKDKISSTFLSTTACANSVFLIGYPPQQTALTGWDINLKEIGSITTILRFVPFYGGQELSNSGFNIKEILNLKPFHKNFKANCITLIDKNISNSSFTKYVNQYTKIIPTRNYKNSFKKIKELINKKSNKKRLIHTYFPELDSTGHEFSVNSKEFHNVFLELDKKIKNLSKTLKKTNTLIIVTADHGMIDYKKELWIENFKGLKECLTIPITGEPRVRDCFIRPRKQKEFEEIIKNKLSKYCWCYKGEDLIKDNLYGLKKPNKKLFDRVGDYVLIMKENYVLKEKIANYDKNRLYGKGVHGGISDDEMFVPLIFFEC